MELFILALIFRFIEATPPSSAVYGVLTVICGIMVSSVINYAMNRWQNNNALVDRLLTRIEKVERDFAAFTGKSNGVNYRQED